MIGLAFSFLSLLTSAAAYGGVDVSQRTYKSSWQCMVQNGKTFAIVRVYQSSGKPDPNGPASISDAWAGGMHYVDGYIFPCYSCGNPAKQMDDTINSLKSYGLSLASVDSPSRDSLNATLGATVGMLWIDVEGTSYWSTSTTNNINFIQGMVDEGVKQGVNLGIYTSASQWNPITGGTTKFAKYPLWYAHYDYNPSFSDFVAFGGWTKPAIKQYQGTTSYCSASVDLNYY
jgi:GH25 family lysozyme M1 (1,4-beta-N-acetylmuramidase)